MKRNVIVGVLAGALTLCASWQLFSAVAEAG
jgi:hypothetical protein